MVRKIVQGTIFPRQDGKIIDEHFGVLNTQHDAFSLAHMFAPAGWREPAQIAEFDEVIIVVKGSLTIESEGVLLEVGAGETCLAERGTRVIYRNASADVPCEYWSLCMPAFRVERTNMHA